MPGNEEILEPHVQNKKLDPYLFKPVTIILSDGRRLVGTMQALTTEGKALFLSNSMEEKLKNELGDMHQWKLPLAKALQYFEVLEGAEIREIRGENTIHSIHTVTERTGQVTLALRLPDRLDQAARSRHRTAARPTRCRCLPGL